MAAGGDIEMNSRVPGKENLHLGEDHSIPHRDQTVSVLDEGSVDPTTPPPYMYETSGDVPPAYTASQAPPYTDEPPPSYETVIERVQKAKKDSKTNSQFACRVCTILFCGPICCTLYLAVWFAVPIACIVIGAMYLYDCPCERYVPIYLLVLGCFGAVKALMGVIEQLRRRWRHLQQHCREGAVADEFEDSERENESFPNCIVGTISCFLFAWFIAGSVWVFSIYDVYQSDDPDADDYCHATVYLFAFWFLIVQYALLGFAILLCLGGCVAMCLCGDYLQSTRA